MYRRLGASGFYYVIDSLTPVRKAVKIAIYKILDLYVKDSFNRHWEGHTFPLKYSRTYPTLRIN
jgi:hypothetical protein